MSIGFRAAGTVAETTTTALSVGAPAGVGSTDISFLVVTVKAYSTDVIVDPDGWAPLVNVVNGSTVSGADTGSVRVRVYTRLGTYGTTSVSLTATPTIAQGVTVAYTKSGGDAWLTPFYGSGFDATDGANYSATGNATTGITTNNWALVFTGIDSDAGTLSALTIAETGAVIGASNTRVNTSTTTGDDSRIVVADAACTSGTGVAAPTFVFTNASSTSGSTGFIRLSVVASALAIATVDPFDDKAGYSLTLSGLNFYDQWELTRASTFSDVYPEEFVRGGELQDTTISGDVIVDYEFHFSDVDSTGEESLIYHLKLYKSGLLQDDLVTATQNPVLHRSLATGFSSAVSPVTFIKDVEDPTHSITAIIQDFNAFQKEGRIVAEHKVIGKKNPIVITDVASGMRGSFTFITTGVSGGFSGGGGDFIYNKQIEDLFNSGSSYYFQSIFPYVVGIPDFFFKVSDYSYSRQNRIARQNVARSADLPANIHPLSIWSVNFIEIDRPGVLDTTSAVKIWGAPSIIGNTWNTVKTNNPRWFDVIEP